MSELTQERLKELIHYCPESGLFTRVITRGSAKKGGSVGVTDANNGYMRVKIDGKNYLLHRLAFLYMEGEFPVGQVDHPNHIRDDNRWCNLRKVTQTENQRNASLRKDNKTGFTGVRWHKLNRKWNSSCSVNGSVISLGSYVTFYAACYARHAANVKYGFHANHGRKE
ncbi:MAG: HNH endonuclease [Sulfurimonas sp.]|nr:HNH endonuclease [Sulfurimonas sp.]